MYQVEGMSKARVDESYMELIREFPLVRLRTKRRFAKAVQMMKKLLKRSTTLTSGEADYLFVLGSLMAEYEKRLDRSAPDTTPQEALSFLMETHELAQVDLVEYVGNKSTLSAFLRGRRGLSKRAAWRLGEYFKVSPALFLSKN